MPDTGPGTQPKTRVTSVDALRGLVMIIMALDHTREFFHAGAMTFQRRTALSVVSLVRSTEGA